MVFSRAGFLRLVLEARGVNPLLYVSTMCHTGPRKRSHLKGKLSVATEGGVFEGLHYGHVRIRHVGVFAH